MLRAAWEAEQARVELGAICIEFRCNPPRTESQVQVLWERLQAAKRRAGGVGVPCRSHDDVTGFRYESTGGEREEERERRETGEESGGEMPPQQQHDPSEAKCEPELVDRPGAGAEGAVEQQLQRLQQLQEPREQW